MYFYRELLIGDFRPHYVIIIHALPLVNALTGGRISPKGGVESAKI